MPTRRIRTKEDLRLTKDNPHLAIHGSFSFMTNFHTMHQYFVNHGGESLHTPYFSGLQVAAFIMGIDETPGVSLRVGGEFRRHV